MKSLFLAVAAIVLVSPAFAISECQEAANKHDVTCGEEIYGASDDDGMQDQNWMRCVERGMEDDGYAIGQDFYFESGGDENGIDVTCK